MNNRRLLFFGIVIGSIILDQLVKAWVRHAFSEHQSPGFPWPGVFELTLTYNKGIAFGMAQGLGTFTIPIALTMAGFATYVSLRHPEDSTLSHVAMACISGGALGNGIDRAINGKVTDMFWFRAINFPVFNVADTFITIAGFLLVVGWLMEALHPKEEEPENATPAQS